MIPAIQEQMGGGNQEMEGDNMRLMDESMSFGAIDIKQVAGVIDLIELPRLRKLVFRSTKGKSYMFTQIIEKDEEYT